LASITKADLDARLEQFKSLMGYEIID